MTTEQLAGVPVTEMPTSHLHQLARSDDPLRGVAITELAARRQKVAEHEVLRARVRQFVTETRMFNVNFWDWIGFDVEALALLQDYAAGNVVTAATVVEDMINSEITARQLAMTGGDAAV